MKKRVIYSLYIDIPKEELDIFDKDVMGKRDIPINYHTKNQFKKHYPNLVACKEVYAKSIDTEFKMFEYDSNYILYASKMKREYPFISTYNIVNFYKIYLLYELAKKYDEVLYLDFDVIPLTTDNFFDVWDLNKGIAVYSNSSKVITIEAIGDKTNTIRSPSSKYYNAQAMLFDQGLSPKNEVINTGIVGANKEHLDKLKYFDNFEKDLKLMTRLKSDTSIFPKKIVDFFGYDNETLFAFKLNQYNVPVQWLDSKWHYFFSNEHFIPKGTKLIHAINKQFDICWRAYNA